MTDREAFIEFTRGFAAGFGIIGVFMLFVITLGLPDSPPEGVESPRFGVVDKYKGCDVVRYTPKDGAKYAYFLDCSRT